MSWIITLLLNSAALLVVDYFIDSIHIVGFTSAVLAAILMGIVNTFIRPILVILTLPISFLTLGFFILVINAITFGLVALFVPGFEISSFSGAFLGAILTSFTSWILNAIFNDR
ncbi:phage holin family protein [Desulfotomaculum defluvii]